jgi:hypothetical protein
MTYEPLKVKTASKSSANSRGIHGDYSTIE